MEETKNKFCSIRSAAKMGIISENGIRGLVKLGLCPGFYIGNRFYVDTDGLLKSLKKMSNQSKKIESYRDKRR